MQLGTSDAPSMPRPDRDNAACNHADQQQQDNQVEVQQPDDHAGIVAKLEAAGMDYALSDIPQIGLRQIFVQEVNGILLELNFRGT